jgi:SAM-dependent methyltransferase
LDGDLKLLKQQKIGRQMNIDFKDEIEQRYKGEKGKQYHETRLFVPDVAYPWVAKLRSCKFSSEVDEKDTLFEYGIGTGLNISRIRCKKRLGFDVAAHLLPIVESQGITFVRETAEIADESIDNVICHHVLEHTSDPPGALREIHRMLRVNNKLLLFVPYEKERKYRRYDPVEPNNHLYSWNVQTLGNLVESCGFKVVKGIIGRFGYDRFAAVWAVRLGVGEIGYRFIRAMCHLVFPSLEVRIIAIKSGSS